MRGACAAPPAPGGSRRAARAPSGCAPARPRRSCSGALLGHGPSAVATRSRRWRRTPRASAGPRRRSRPGSPIRSRATTTPRGSPRKTERGEQGPAALAPAPGPPGEPVRAGPRSEASLGRDPRSSVTFGSRPVRDRGRRRDDQILALPEQDDQCPRVDQRPAAFDDRLEHPIEVGLAAHRDRDVGPPPAASAPPGEARRGPVCGR